MLDLLELWTLIMSKTGETVSKTTFFLSEEHFKTTKNLLHLKRHFFAGFI